MRFVAARSSELASASAVLDGAAAKKSCWASGTISDCFILIKEPERRAEQVFMVNRGGGRMVKRVFSDFTFFRRKYQFLAQSEAGNDPPPSTIG